VLKKLSVQHKKKPIDMVLIETTGLADPGPVAQTFFVEQSIAKKFRLDAIITMVDSVNILRCLNEKSPETQRQIAFADVIILNKVDLLGAIDRGLCEILERREFVSTTKKEKDSAGMHEEEESKPKTEKVEPPKADCLQRAIEMQEEFRKNSSNSMEPVDEATKEASLKFIEKKIREMNFQARLFRSSKCDVDLNQILSLGGFNVRICLF